MPGNGHVRCGGRAEETDGGNTSTAPRSDPTAGGCSPPREGNNPAGPARWWLWVFLGPDTACFVMDPTRSGAVLARHAGIDQTTGRLVEHPGAGEEEGPRQLVVSSDFYSVYTSAGRKAAGLVNLYCWAQYAEPGIMRNPSFGA